MRVLAVSRSLPFHQQGGMEIVAWDLLTELARTGFAVDVITAGGGDLADDSEVQGVRLFSVAADHARYSADWWRLTTKRFEELRRRDDYDAVLSISIGAMGIVASTRQNLDRPTSILQVHSTAARAISSRLSAGGAMNHLKAAKALADMARDVRYRAFDQIVAISQRVKEDLTTFPMSAVIGNIPIETIVNGINDTRFAFSAHDREAIRVALGIDQNTTVVLSVSRLHPEKGIDLSLEALAAARRSKPISFVVVGSGPHLDHLRAKATRLGIVDQVHFVGSVPHDQVGRYYSAADAFLSASLAPEGLPTNILEALGSGLRILASSNSADPALPLEVFAPNDASAIVKALLTLGPAALDRRSRLPREYTIERAAASYSALINRVVTANRSAPGQPLSPGWSRRTRRANSE